jgi:hypothetical protein
MGIRGQEIPNIPRFQSPGFISGLGVGSAFFGNLKGHDSHKRVSGFPGMIQASECVFQGFRYT